MTTEDARPTLDEAMERLSGRRAQAIEVGLLGRVLWENKGQNRKTRRNNLRLARIAGRPRG